jgi:hypothetical protein
MSSMSMAARPTNVRLGTKRHAQCADECPLLGANRTFDQPLLTDLDL